MSEALTHLRNLEAERADAADKVMTTTGKAKADELARLRYLTAAVDEAHRVVSAIERGDA